MKLNGTTVPGASASVAPTSTTTYTLTATNLIGSVSAILTVSVGTPGTLVWTKTIVYGFGQELAEDQPGMGTTFIQSDFVGSPSFLTDASGAVIGQSKNLPFGERMSSWGQKTIRRYTNHEDDADSNAIYMQAREQLPAYGKFAQVDPAYDQTKDDPESWNLYNYTTNNPVTHTDPDGRIDKTDAERQQEDMNSIYDSLFGDSMVAYLTMGTNFSAEMAIDSYRAQNPNIPMASVTVTIGDTTTLSPAPALQTVTPSVTSSPAQTGGVGFDTTVDTSFTPQLFDRLALRDASQLSLSTEGREAIEGDEGNRSYVYPDSAVPPNPTSGVGHCLKGDEIKTYPMKSKVPLAVRENWFTGDLSSAQATVRNLVKAPINQFQFDALTNFAFQMGPIKLGASNLLRDINQAVPDQFGIRGLAPSSQQIYQDFHGWNKGGKGIPARRDREINLYNNGIYP